jgi:Arc/MetJ-type ribon-helix-helix transcriptional regulator
MGESESKVRGWFVGRMPDGWFAGAPDVVIDRDEILVVGELVEPDYPNDADDGGKAAARRARIERFREETRDQRIRIAEEAERRIGRKVAWGAECGDERVLFTVLSVPVMTRLRMPERLVLDTLVGAGVARSRSEALAWCVRLVREHQGEWIQQLRDALVGVEDARASGPNPSTA